MQSYSCETLCSYFLTTIKTRAMRQSVLLLINTSSTILFLICSDLLLPFLHYNYESQATVLETIANEERLNHNVIGLIFSVSNKQLTHYKLSTNRPGKWQPNLEWRCSSGLTICSSVTVKLEAALEPSCYNKNYSWWKAVTLLYT